MSEFRKGMWVLVDGRVGILNSFDKAAGEVHLCNEDGTTKLVLTAVPLGSVKQASFNDIPLARRPERKRAFSLGYLTKEQLT